MTVRSPAIATSSSSREVSASAPPSLVRRKCACGGKPGPHGECDECRENRLKRHPDGAAGREPAAVPPIVGEVLSSPGRSLDPAGRAFMESRLGHDFGAVRVHAGGRAAESARAVERLGVHGWQPHRFRQRTVCAGNISRRQTARTRAHPRRPAVHPPRSQTPDAR